MPAARLTRVLLLLAAALSAAFLSSPTLSAQDYRPALKPASDEGVKAIEKFRYPGDLEVTLFAAEPRLANPVAFCIDTRGRLFIAETFRLHKGVTDNRSHRDWLDEELACRTVADRIEMYERKFKKEISKWTSEHERVRMIEDTDGDGVADRSTVFADGFRELPDGIGAGLLSYAGKVWFTCIPKLWLLEDEDGDGRADRKEVLHDGYGVHTSLLGHDLHGLRIGPDGMLYFSIGDRGFHVVTPEKTLSFPDEGAVLRCHLDGSGLEVVHRGLRNPQELAFDRFGNLFTGDNNSDGGDKARWVYVVPGGHSGWHIGFQSISDRGPWNREKLWHPQWDGQAAYIIPPIDNLINGPSGLTYDPGVGLPARFRDRFFLCEFRGGSSISGVVAVKCAPRGAGFELTDVEEFLWKVLPTDVEFGFDGRLYVSDWTEGWGQTAKGRIYRVGIPGIGDRSDIRATAALMQKGLGELDREALLALLDHADQRVRQEAQFEAVRRGLTKPLQQLVKSFAPRMARIHGIWALGQLARKDAKVLGPIRSVLEDPDHEIRSQVAKVLGEAGDSEAVEPLITLLRDRSARVRFFAAISLGQLGDPDAIQPLIEMLAKDEERDPYLRHAGVQGLVGMPDEEALLKHADHPSRAVRLALVVALRQRRSAAVRSFLTDADVRVAREAARAIHDEPIVAGMPDLAAQIEADGMQDDTFLRRAINANFRVGTPESMGRLVAFAIDSERDARLRAEAVACLKVWPKPSNRDRVINLWRPLQPRTKAPVLAGLKPHWDQLLRADAPVARAAIEALRSLGEKAPSPTLRALVRDSSVPARVRADALDALRGFGDDELVACAKVAAETKAVGLRRLGLRILADEDPDGAVPVLTALVREAKKTSERQSALEILGDLKTDKVVPAMLPMLDDLIAGKVDGEIQLDLIRAVKKRKAAALEAKLEAYEEQRDEAAAGDLAKMYVEALRGGNAREGRKVFFQRDDASSCKKCHAIGGRGGNAGPDLSTVGSRLSRAELLTSLVDPSRAIAEGFGTIVFTLDDDSVVAGIPKKETETEIVVMDANEKEIRIEKKRVKERSDPVSSMPPMAGLLNRAELRDLVQFLSERVEKKKKKKDQKVKGH